MLTLAASRRPSTADSALHKRPSDCAPTRNRTGRFLRLAPTGHSISATHRQALLELSGASLEDRGIELRLSTEEIWIDGARGWRVCLIVAELVRNAVRHGLQGRPGVIDVDVKTAGLRIQCIVTDDGCAETDPVEGRGRRLVRALAAELQGSVNWWFTNSGSTVNVEFPIVQPNDFPHPAPARF